jgi:hypothetical protein
VLKQIAVTRARPAATGHVHFSMAALMENRQGITDQLKAVHYGQPALVPATPWLGSEAPGLPLVSSHREGNAVTIKLTPGKNTIQYAIWSLHGGTWRFAVVQADKKEWSIADASAVFVSAYRPARQRKRPCRRPERQMSGRHRAITACYELCVSIHSHHAGPRLTLA